MSLQVWLPLNKKIVNAGLGNVNVINNGVTISDNGILGKCGSFTPGQYIEFTNVPFSKLNNCSVSFWIKLDANEGKWLPLSGQGEPYYILAWQSESYNNGNFYSMNAGSNHKIYVDGVQSNKPIRDGNWHHYCIVGANFSSWTKFYVNRYYNESNVYNFTGLLNDFRIYDYALSAADVLRIYQNKNIYEIPTVPGSPTPDLPLWVKVLHHNVPSSNLFTTANAKKNTTESLYSRLGIYFNSTIFKNPYGKYEFLAKEKLESGSTEQSYQWRQTSSPTASTIAGFEKIKNTNNSERLIGLKSTNSYATFHNGSAWWCACGSYTAFQGGIPGFGDIVKSGYLDLYAKARIGHLPKSYENEYEELEYIEGTGTQCIRTDLIQNIDDKIIIDLSYTPAALSGWFGGNAYTQVQVNSTNGFTANTHSNVLVEYKERTEYISINETLKKTYSWSTATNYNNIKICLFALGTSQTQASGFSSGKIFYAKLYENDKLIHNLIPSKRKSDNVIGMYDLVSKKFFTNQGTGVFNAGPSVISLPKEYEKLEYIEGTGTQYIDTEILLSNKDKFELKFQRLSTTSSFNPIFGAIGGGESYTSTNNFSLTYMSNNKYAIYCDGAAGNGSYAWLGGDVTDQKIYTISYNGLNVNPIINGSAMTQSTQHALTENSPTKTTWLFGRNNTGSGTISNSQLKVFYLKMWNNGLMVRHFIPSKRKSDNVIGMYDIVSGQFFTNSGTGSFTGA